MSDQSWGCFSRVSDVFQPFFHKSRWYFSLHVLGLEPFAPVLLCPFLDGFLILSFSHHISYSRTLPFPAQIPLLCLPSLQLLLMLPYSMRLAISFRYPNIFNPPSSLFVYSFSSLTCFPSNPPILSVILIVFSSPS